MPSGRVVEASSHADTASRFDELVQAFARLREPQIVAAFLEDLCTAAELDAMGQRLQVARLVDEGIAYHEISRRTGASTATITRVAQWVRRGTGGYRAVLRQRKRP
jgi:TrpR-related protein YerC/YecD